MNNILQALLIFHKYDTNFTVEAQHDELFVRLDKDIVISEEDKKKLDDLFWVIDNSYPNFWMTFT